MSNSALMSQLVQQQTSPFQPPQQPAQGGIPGKGGASSIPGKGGAAPTAGIPGRGFQPVMAPPVQIPPQAMMAMQRGAMGSSSMRDQAMSQVLGPFTQPNWGVPQVPQMPAGGMPQPRPAPVAPPPSIPVPGPRPVKFGHFGLR